MRQEITTKNSIVFVSVMCLVGGAILAAQGIGAMSLVEQVEQSTGKQAPAVTLAVVENPEIVARVLESLLRSILFSNGVDFQQQQQASSMNNGAVKRGLDLGISRGFSGSQAGKHLMGLSAASFANGPGRR